LLLSCVLARRPQGRRSADNLEEGRSLPEVFNSRNGIRGPSSKIEENIVASIVICADLECAVCAGWNTVIPPALALHA
jgi:hypothetical protein